MTEAAKRLEPTKETIRELFAKSGNQCAFPGCGHLLIDSTGTFVAQMCHIEAAEKGGERFNESMTNEERRHVSNLMLMCYAHHVLSDDVVAYPAERLRQMKADHEAKYTNAAEVIWKAIVDSSTTQPVTAALTLRRFHDTMKWTLTDEQLRETFGEFDDFQQRLRQVPRQTRQLLLVLVNRAGEPDSPKHLMSVPHDEVCRACGIENRTLISHVTTLERWKLAYSDHEDMLQPMVSLRPLQSGWPVWQELKAFCKATGVSLHDIVIELRMNLLD